MELNLQQRSLLVLLSVCRLGSNFQLHIGGRSQGGRGHVTGPCTHIALGNLLPLTGILQGADTEVRDGDSGTGSQCDQHEESPQAAVQRQLQAVVLLQREGWNIHFTPGDISGDGESRDYSKAIKKTPEPPFHTNFLSTKLHCLDTGYWSGKLARVPRPRVLSRPNVF